MGTCIIVEYQWFPLVTVSRIDAGCVVDEEIHLLLTVCNVSDGVLQAGFVTCVVILLRCTNVHHGSGRHV